MLSLLVCLYHISCVLAGPLVTPSMGSGPLVTTSLGPVIGSVHTTSHNTTYASFQRLPYASPPIGPLRLRLPQPAPHWETPLDLSGSSSPQCPQSVLDGVQSTVVGEEDCLYVNVYTPAVDNGQVQPEAGLPVLVWIYGGGFLQGSARYEEYGPDLWLYQGLLVVVVNYRVGALGFLSLGIPETPGNQGLVDQQAALHLVQDSIQAFGGDPGRVTLAGQSAGSSSCLYHLMSPGSAGLFHQVIAQSGSNFSPSLHSITGTQAARYGREAAVSAGCILGDDHHRLECLQGVDVARLAGMSAVLSVNLKPNEDGDYASTPFLPMSPMEALRTGNYLQDVAVLVGSNRDDGLILTSLLETTPSMYLVYRNFWSVMAPGILFHVPVDESSAEYSRKANELADFYLGGTQNIVPENFGTITTMFTDAFATYPVECFVKYSQHTQRVYQYMYTHEGEYGLNPDAGVPKLGVNHADELYLMWDPLYSAHHPLNRPDEEMSQVLLSLWSSFIKTGVPASQIVPEYWEPVTTENSRYMVLDNDPKMDKSQDYKDRMDFWNQLFPC